MRANWKDYAGQGGWWKRAPMPGNGGLLTGDQAAYLAQAQAQVDGKRRRRSRRGRRR